jgi:hypothetical protein
MSYFEQLLVVCEKYRLKNEWRCVFYITLWPFHTAQWFHTSVWLFSYRNKPFCLSRKEVIYINNLVKKFFQKKENFCKNCLCKLIKKISNAFSIFTLTTSSSLPFFYDRAVGVGGKQKRKTRNEENIEKKSVEERETDIEKAEKENLEEKNVEIINIFLVMYDECYILLI